MKKSFMTRALAMGLSLAMAFSLSAATNVSVASAAATPAMASKQFAVRVGGEAKSYKASTATQKSFKITKATVGNTDKATVKVNSSKKSIKVTPGTVTGTTVVTVTFKNIKTAKSTAKKYRCVVKAAIEPEKPVEPEVVKATKISEAKVSTAKTVTVTFDGVVDTSSATAIKLARGTIEAPVTVAYATDSKSATLTSATPLAAGTYTLTVGSFEPVSITVTKQTPTKLEITATTVANTDDAGVGFQVLDQYGDPMDSYTSNKLEIKAYNSTKGHDIQHHTNNKAYFTLDCATQDVSGTAKVINSLGDKVNVVAYLRDNASVSTTAELTITNIYMESLEFGEPELGDDKRVTVEKTYKLPYTAKTNEGNDAKFINVTAGGDQVISKTFGNYRFVTSNVAALDLADMYADKDGNLFFAANETAGTAIITAINTNTGTTVSTTIVVNDVPTLSRVDVADASIACDSTTGDVKAAVTAYDQFDEVIDAKNIKNLTFTQDSDSAAHLSGMFASVTTVPGTANIRVKKFSSDGKYLVYGITDKNNNGQKITFNFTSEKAGSNGYITSQSIVEVNDRVEPGALTIVTAPDATKQEEGTVKVEFSLLDQYQNKVALTGVNLTNHSIYYDAPASGTVLPTRYNVTVETQGAVSGYAIATAPDTNPMIVDGTDNTVGKFVFELPSIDDLSKDAKITLKLSAGTDQIASKKFDVKVVKAISDYDVMTEKTSYTAGDTITVNVNAYSMVNTQRVFNRFYNGKHDVEIELTKDGDVQPNTKTRKTLEFKDGMASFTMTAGKKTAPGEKYKYTVKKVDDPAVNSTHFNLENDGFTVGTNSANKIVANDSMDRLQIVDSQGNKLTGSGTSYAQIIVKDETLGSDITNVSTITSDGNTISLNDKTAVVVLDGDKNILTIAGKVYSMGHGFVVTVPATSKDHNISLSITVDGCTWKDTVRSDTAATPTAIFQNNDCKGTAATVLATRKADHDYALVKTAITSLSAITSSGSGIEVSGSAVSKVSAASITVTTAGITSSGAVSASALGTSGVYNLSSAKQIGFKVESVPGSVNDSITVTYQIGVTATETTPANANVSYVKELKVKYSYNGTKWVANVVGEKDL